MVNKGLDELFDKVLRPLRSKNARKIFMIFLERRDALYLTTYDLQNRLHQDGVELTKVELNNWLKSLNDAEIITKGEERGKPTTIEYEDRYTYDMWSLTPQGFRIAADLNKLINGSSLHLDEEEAYSPPDEIKAHKDTQLSASEIEVSSLQTSLLNILWSEKSSVTMEEIKQGFIPPDGLIEDVLSNLISRGIIQEDEALTSKGLLAKVMRLIGFSPRKDVVFRLTEKGRKMATGKLV